MALSWHWSAPNPHPTYYAILPGHQMQLGYQFTTPSLNSEFAFQHEIYVASRDAMVFLTESIAQLALFSFCCLVALAYCLNRRTFDRVLLAFLVILPISTPIFIIAKDWGRFLAYDFFLALVSTALWQTTISSSEHAVPGLISRLADRLRAVSKVDLLLLATVYLLVNSANPWTSHFVGLSHLNAQNFCIVAVVALLARILRPASSANGGH